MGTLQRVTNCIVKKNEQVLLLQKPSRNWWVAPGGKMETGESIKEAVVREYREETGLIIQNPEIKGVFTIVIKEAEAVVNEWMLFTFLATEIDGELLTQSPEGDLKWHLENEILHLPMAPGDKFIFQHILHSNKTIYGTFYYTKDFELLDYQLDPDIR